MPKPPVEHFRLTGEAMVEICKKIVAERAAWRKALGVPQGFDIPKAPIPPTAAECRAEIAVLEKLEGDAYHLSQSLPPGQERVSAVAAMDVQDMLGHASLHTTQHYLEPSSDAKRRLVDLV